MNPSLVQSSPATSAAQPTASAEKPQLPQAPAQNRSHPFRPHHRGRHHMRPHWGWLWRLSHGRRPHHGPRRRSHHGPGRRPHHGTGRRHHHGRHHFRRHCFGRFVLFFIVIPGIICLIFRCKRKRIYKRINKLLEIENRLFRAKHGFEWSINKKLTTLTLKQVSGASLGYPAQLSYPQQEATHTPFCVQPTEGPMFTEHAPLATGRHQPAQGYQRVSLDDSAVCYR